MIIVMEEDESIRHYMQRMKALIHKLPNLPIDMLHVEWYIQGMGTSLEFKVRRSHLATLVVAI